MTLNQQFSYIFNFRLTKVKEKHEKEVLYLDS